MGYTFRLFAAGGVDAVEREYGHGRTSALRRPEAARGVDKDTKRMKIPSIVTNCTKKSAGAREMRHSAI
jgi:hypothetical protein